MTTHAIVLLGSDVPVHLIVIGLPQTAMACGPNGAHAIHRFERETPDGATNFLDRNALARILPRLVLVEQMWLDLDVAFRAR